MTSLSLHFNGHFPGEPGLAGVYWSKGWWRWWRQLDYLSYKLQSNHHHQHPVSFTGRMPFLSPNHQCQSTEGKISHSMDLLTLSSPGVFQLCLWPLIAPGYLGGGLPCLSSALWCQYLWIDDVCSKEISLTLLPLPRRFCFCPCVCMSVCLSVCQQDNSKSCGWILMSFRRGYDTTG